MTKIEELRTELQQLEPKLIEFQKIKNPTAAQLAQVNDVCDQIEAITTEVRVLEAGRRDRDFREKKDEQAFYGRLGEYLQAACAATAEPGQRFGRFESGRVYRDVLLPENRSTGMEESLPSGGGFLVTQDTAEQLFWRATQASIIYKKTRMIPISPNANGLKINAWDESSRVAGSRWGGLSVGWTEEGGSITASRPKLRSMELSLKKLSGLCYATSELLQDHVALGTVIAQAFEEEFSTVLDNMCIRGTGAGQGLGVMNASCLIAVTGASSANTLVANDVVAMYSRLWPRSEPKAEFFANLDTFPQLVRMNSKQLDASLAGDLLWKPANAMVGQPHQTLFGRPLHYVEPASTVGDKGDLLLCDWSQYVTITKGGVQAASSVHVAFTTDEVCFRFTLRTDAQPLWASAVTPAQGTDTQSPFITVATR